MTPRRNAGRSRSTSRQRAGPHAIRVCCLIAGALAINVTLVTNGRSARPGDPGSGDDAPTQTSHHHERFRQATAGCLRIGLDGLEFASGRPQTQSS